MPVVRIAFVTSRTSRENDFDMSPLLAACRALGLGIDVRDWDDPGVDWARYGSVVLRSPWDYVDRLADFLAWCGRVSDVTTLHNPLPAIRWSLDKSYLADLERRDVPIVPTLFLDRGSCARSAVDAFASQHAGAGAFVVKPTVGCYSRGVCRFDRRRVAEAAAYADDIVGRRSTAMVQPYMRSIDAQGETDVILFDGVYSHAIRKGALLGRGGTADVPSYDFRSRREAEADEREVAMAAIAAAAGHLALDRPLLYSRVDLVRGEDGRPRVLELEIAEPSLSLPLADGSADRFARSIARSLEVAR